MASGRACGICLLVACAAAACGKKGPPLAPLVRVPVAVSQLSARRVGSDAYITLTIPAQNVDGTGPADVSRVDVFAVTADTAPPPGEFLRAASRIAVIRVAPPPDATRPADPAPEGVAQGSQVVVREPLTPERLTPAVAPGVPAASKAAAAPRAEETSRPDPAAPTSASAVTTPAGPQRFYVAYAYSDRQRSSAVSAMAMVPAGPLPDPPAGLAATYTESELVLSWKPSTAMSSFNVYRSPAETAPGAAGPAVVIASPPAPANQAPLTTPTFPDAVQFGVKRCYVVRTVAGVGADAVESAPSNETCVTPVDTFPPAAPTGLNAVSRDDGGIELRWTANQEPDVRGYLILRGNASDATLLPITDAPIAETRFIDRSVVAGVSYVYAVVAVDSGTPPNRSAESARDPATAR